MLNILHVVDNLITYLAEAASPEQILAFSASEEAEARAEWLLERNQDGTLTLEERLELDQMLHINKLGSLLKAKALESFHNS